MGFYPGLQRNWNQQPTIYPDSTLLFSDDFGDGYDGWTELMDGSVPRPSVARVSYPAMSGGFALRLATSALVDPTTNPSAFAVAIKRLTRFHNTGVVNFDLFWSFGTTDYPNAPKNIEFGFDTQSRSGTRAYPKFRWQVVNPSGGAPSYFTWAIKNDSIAFVNVPGAVYSFPFNENKQNYIYSRFRFDLVAGYRSMWIYDDYYDLSGLGCGTGAETTVTNFNGGLNFYIGLTNNDSAHGAQAWVDVDHCRGWYE